MHATRISSAIFAFLTVVCVSPGALLAQFLPTHEGVRLKTMSYENSSGETGTTDFFYRRDGRLDTSFWTLVDGSRFSANHYVIDEAGHILEKYREFSDGLTSTQHFVYDADGHRVREDFHRSDGISGSAEFFWSDDDRLARAVFEKFRGWLTADISYVHEGERLVRADVRRDDQPFGTVRYIYDPAGHLAEETWNLGGWSQTFGYEYEPVPPVVFGFSSPLVSMNSRFVVTAEDYDFNGESGGPSTYTYDEDGRLKTKTFVRSDSLKTVTSFSYRADGALKTSHREYGDGRTVDFTYVVDPALRLLERTFVRSDGAEGFERYTYDRWGRLEAATCRNVDFWLSGTIAFRYDDHGHLSGGRFSGDDGFDADLEITTDSVGNVTTVLWRFSFGKTQTYTFGYSPADSVRAGG